MPAWPRAGPIGGAGVALPPGICNFTFLTAFLAIDLVPLLYYRVVIHATFRASPANIEATMIINHILFNARSYTIPRCSMAQIFTSLLVIE